MGVPCLTLAGSCHAHNVGVSLLTAVGLHPPAAAAAAGEGGSRMGSSAAVVVGEAGGAGSSGSSRSGSAGVGGGSGSGTGSSSCWWRGPSWVAHSEAEYVALAVAHAANVQVGAAAEGRGLGRLLAVPRPLRSRKAGQVDVDVTLSAQGCPSLSGTRDCVLTDFMVTRS